MMDWNISRSQRRCSKCEKEFAEEEEYFSALFDAGATFERKDFCPACWTDTTKPAFFSFWKTEIPKPEQQKKLFVDDSVIFDFFRKLADDEAEPAKRNFRYILALMLMRKKVLKFKDVAREHDKEYIVLRRSRTQEEHRVLNPQLTEAEMEQVKLELTKILETEVV